MKLKSEISFNQIMNISSLYTLVQLVFFVLATACLTAIVYQLIIGIPIDENLKNGCFRMCFGVVILAMLRLLAFED